MPRNGSGTYSLPASSWNPATTGTTIESSAANTTLTDLASALTQSLSKDGQTMPTGNIQMGGYKLTNLGDGATATDAATYGQTLHTTGNQTLSGDLIINGAVSLSGDLSITGTVIFTSGNISVANLTVTSAASVASLRVAGTTNANILNVASTASLNTLAVSSVSNLNILNVASVASLNTLTVASTAAIAVLSVGSSLVVGAASGGGKGAGTINAKGYFLEGAALSSGVTLQMVRSESGSVATIGSSWSVFADSVPANNTGGGQIMSQAITPSNASNRLKIDVVAFVACDTTTPINVGLFQDSTTAALAMGGVDNPATGKLREVSFTHHMAAGTTSSTTFKVWLGAAVANCTFNGVAGGRIYGGVMASSITITEYTP